MVLSQQISTNIHWPGYCTITLFILASIFVLVCGHFWAEANLFRFCFHCMLYLSCCWRWNYEEEVGWNSINQLTPPLPLKSFVCLSKTGPGFFNSIWHSLFLCSLIWGKEIFVNFVDISGIVYYNCLNFFHSFFYHSSSVEIVNINPELIIKTML